MEAVKGFLHQCQEFFLAFGQTFMDYISNPWIATGVAVLLVALVLFFILSKKQPSRIRAFTNGNGYVEISRAALVDIVRSQSEQVDIEKKPGVAIRSIRGKLHVDVKIRLLPSRRLTEVSEILQQHLREALEDGLGIRKLGNINVMVVGVRVKKGKDIRKSLPLNPRKKDSEEPKSLDSEAESGAFVVVDDPKSDSSSSEHISKGSGSDDSITKVSEPTEEKLSTDKQNFDAPTSISETASDAEESSIKRGSKD